MNRLAAAGDVARGALQAVAGLAAHGDIAFTVPLFDEYLHRVMPE